MPPTARFPLAAELKYDFRELGAYLGNVGLQMAYTNLKFNGTLLMMHKAVKHPEFGARTVLVMDPWSYVDLWLKREGHGSAIFYWHQAKAFFDASRQLPSASSPLTSYYCFLNAVKTLLIVKRVRSSDEHGVTGSRTRGARAALSNEKITLSTSGVLPALIRYFGETEATTEYTLKDLLANLPYIHRAYCLTYTTQRNLFIPLRQAGYVRKTGSTEAWFCCEFEPQYASAITVKTLPRGFEHDEGLTKQFTVRLKNRFRWRSGREHKSQNLENIRNYHTKLRTNVVYINGPMRLWYLKRHISGTTIVHRYTPVIAYAAMHRLSELSRYQPTTLQRYLESQQNWLLSEFIQAAPIQFIDEIASEITGREFMIPGIRTARG